MWRRSGTWSIAVSMIAAAGCATSSAAAETASDPASAESAATGNDETSDLIFDDCGDDETASR